MGIDHAGKQGTKGMSSICCVIIVVNNSLRKRMKTRILLLLAIIASLFVGFSIPVGAQATLYENYTAGGDADSVAIYGGNFVAEQFTSNATSHTVTAITVELLRVGTPSAIEIGLWNAAAGVPTTEITSTILTGTSLSTTYTFYTVLITSTSLQPSTQYAVVVSVPSGDNANYVQWHQDAGGGLASAIGSDSADSGISWTPDAGGADYLFQIWGGVVFDVVGANVFEDYLVDGDWLIVIETINSYPVYAESADVSRYFNVQLLNVAGTAVLGATTLKDWGYAPCAIYLSPTSVIPLTSGSAYIIKMIGTFIGNPSTTYVLTAEDWAGGDLRYLDQWCLKTAKSMNDYDGNTTTVPYTTKTSVGGEVLTTYGGGDFIDSIPMIMSVRPDLFETSTTIPDYEVGTATNAYDTAHDWEDQVGVIIEGDAAAFGTVFGITAKQFLQLGVWLAYIGAMLFIFASKQGAETVFVGLMCIPILLIGLNFRLIEFYIIGVMATLAVLLFVVKMWFTK